MPDSNHKSLLLKLEVPERRPTFTEETSKNAASSLRSAIQQLGEKIPLITWVLKGKKGSSDDDSSE